MNNIKKRIDNLGRIVLPKQIREELKLKEYDELEILIEDNSIRLKKSIGILKYKDKIDRFLLFLTRIYNFYILVLDQDKIISSNKLEIVGGKVKELSIYEYKNELINFKTNLNCDLSGYICMEKLIVDSNLLGYMIVLSNTSLSNYFQDILYIKETLLDLIN